jgi:hypothetical protein
MVQEYSDVAALAETLSQGTAEPRALVVGHSNTVPELLQALGVTEATTIGEDEFDRLFVVVIRNDGQVQFRQQRYIGEPVSTVARPVIQEAAGPVSPPPTTSLEAMEEHLRQVQVELTQLQEEMQKLKRELQPQENQH